jgi:hypothetical protein
MSEIQQGSLWAKITVSVGISRAEFGGSRGKVISLHFPTFRSHPHFLAHGPSLPSSKSALSHLCDSSLVVQCFFDHQEKIFNFKDLRE